MVKKQEVKLNIGCGVGLLSGFINVDKYLKLEDLLHGEKTKQGQYSNSIVPEGAEFVQGDICKLSFEDNYADYILCVDVIEHIRVRDLGFAFRELYRVLKPKGKMLMMTTDFTDLAEKWVELRKGKFDLVSYLDLLEIIYGNQAGENEGELHKAGFSNDFLNLCLQDGGFKKYTMTGYARGSLHPDLGGYFDWAKGTLVRSAMFVVDATK